MKTRIITSLIAGIPLFISLAFYNTFVFEIAIAGVAVICISELFNSIFQKKHYSMLFLSYTIPFFIILFNQTISQKYSTVFVFIIVMLNAMLILLYHKTVNIATFSLFISMSLFISSVLNVAIIFRDYYGHNGILFTCISLGSAWFSDIGAYFSGYFFGKHKLAPTISPKKTIEGVIGGAVFNIFCTYVLILIIKSLYNIDVDIILILFISTIASLMSVVGDLMASIIKRQYNIKDFGDVMPGHGGFMDRFDSVLFTIPTVFVLINLI